MTGRELLAVLGTVITLVGGLGGAIASGDARAALYGIGFLVIGMALGVTLLPVGVAAMALGLQLWRTVGPLKSMAEARAQAVLAWLKARGETEVGVWLVAMSFFFALALLLAVAGDDFGRGGV